MGQDAVGDHGGGVAGAFAGVFVAESLTGGIVSDGDIGGLSEGPLEMGVSLFAAAATFGGVAGLGDAGNQSAVRDEVLGALEAVDLADLIVDGQGEGIADAWEGEESLKAGFLKGDVLKVFIALGDLAGEEFLALDQHQAIGFEFFGDGQGLQVLGGELFELFEGEGIEVIAQ